MHSTIARKMTDLQFGRCMLIPHVVPVAEEEEEGVGISIGNGIGTV